MSHIERFSLFWTCVLPEVLPKEPWSSQHHGSDPPSGTSLEQGSKYRYLLDAFTECACTQSVCLSPHMVPLSGWACRMPSAVWKAWKELGKSTSGSDSSTSWSKDIMASIIPIWVWLQLHHSACCRKVRITVLLGWFSFSTLLASEHPWKKQLVNFQRWRDQICLQSFLKSLHHSAYYIILKGHAFF